MVTETSLGSRTVSALFELIGIVLVFLGLYAGVLTVVYGMVAGTPWTILGGIGLLLGVPFVIGEVLEE